MEGRIQIKVRADSIYTQEPSNTIGVIDYFHIYLTLSDAITNVGECSTNEFVLQKKFEFEFGTYKIERIYWNVGDREALFFHKESLIIECSEAQCQNDAVQGRIYCQAHQID